MDWNVLRKEYDPQDYYTDLIKFPEHVRKALTQMKDFNIEFKPRNILVCGMGGSGIPGHFLKTYCNQKSSIQAEVESGYDLPGWAGKDTLVILISYSGNTEETLSCLKQALDKKLKIIAIASGGLLERAAIKYNLPFIKAPGKFQPRAASPYLFTYLLEITRKLGFTNPDYEEALNELSKMDLTIEKNNPIKGLAEGLLNKYIYVYVPKTLDSIGYRYVAQDFNENAKTLAKHSVIPEANHNETCAWPEKQDVPVTALFIEDMQASDSIKERMTFQESVCLKKKGEYITIIHTKGKDLLSRMLTVIYQGDMLSYYMSLLRHKNPLPVIIVEELKKHIESRTTLKKDLITSLKLE